MLRTSYTLTPAPLRVEDAQLHGQQSVQNVFLCATSPAVTEQWEGYQHAPHVQITNGASLSISPTVEAPLSLLLRSYEASATEQGCSAVQVLALGVHQTLSAEAKAMIAGAAMCTLRLRLHQLLAQHTYVDAETSRTAAAGGEGLRATLQRWCRRTRSAPPHLSHSVDEERRDERGEMWRITWSPELLHTVAAASLSPEAQPQMTAPTVKVSGCSDAMRCSVEGILRTRLLRDSMRQSHSGSKNAMSMKQDVFAVHLTHCAAVAAHPLDVRCAMEVGCRLYTDCLTKSQEYAEDGTEAFQGVLRLSQRIKSSASSPPSPSTSDENVEGQVAERWHAALQNYHESAAAAQRGVLFLVTHDVAAYGTSPLMPLRANEERARVVAAAAALAATTARVCADRGLAETVIAPLRVRSAGAYVNDVLLPMQWDLAASDSNSTTARVVAQMLGSDAEDASLLLAPARAALQWRLRLPGPPAQPPAVSLPVTTAEVGGKNAEVPSFVGGGGATLRPTPLQYILYVLRRQLVVAVANTAQVLLTGTRLPPRSLCLANADSATAAGTQQPLSASSLRAQALRCVKAEALLRGLLRWHCPCPIPQLGEDGHGGGSASDEVHRALSPAAMGELLWCLRLLAKLHHRAAALFGSAGDSDGQQAQLRQWRDQLQRWESRREKMNDAAGRGPQCGAKGQWECSVENLAGHVEAAQWSLFVKEVSAGLPKG